MTESNGADVYIIHDNNEKGKTEEYRCPDDSANYTYSFPNESDEFIIITDSTEIYIYIGYFVTIYHQDYISNQILMNYANIYLKMVIPNYAQLSLVN